jgi:hypothetical protein
MRRHFTTFSLLAAFCAFAASAYGQDEPRLGLTMGFPGAVGVLWRAADRVGLRAEITATRTSGDSSSSLSISLNGVPTSATALTTWQVGTGVSALLYLTRDAGFRTYVTPRVAYTTMSSSTEPSGTVVSSTSDGHAWSTSGSFGAQYSFSRRFGVFGEAGVTYSTTTTHSSSVQTTTTVVGIGTGSLVTSPTNVTFESEGHSRSTGLRGGAGVIVYLGR